MESPTWTFDPSPQWSCFSPPVSGGAIGRCHHGTSSHWGAPKRMKGLPRWLKSLGKSLRESITKTLPKKLALRTKKSGWLEVGRLLSSCDFAYFRVRTVSLREGTKVILLWVSSVDCGFLNVNPSKICEQTFGFCKSALQIQDWSIGPLGM